MNTYILCLALASVPFFQACGTGNSSDVKQTTIVQTYDVRLIEADNRLRAEATFNYDNNFGTTLRLDGDSWVRFEGEAMDRQNVLNMTSYVREESANRYPDRSYAFEYSNNSGELSSIQVQIPEASGVILPSGSSAGIPADQSLHLEIWGAELQHNERIQVCLKGENKSECADSANKGLRFDASSLARLPRDQELELTLTRTITTTENKITKRATFVARSQFVTLH